MKILRKTLKFLWQSLLFLVAVIMLTVVLKTFVISSFRIPSSSMAPSLEEGDFVMVNKVIFGGRLYNLCDSIKPSAIKRAWGIRKIRRGDVLVFNSPFRKNRREIEFNPDVFYIKRCVATPGDTFRIADGFYCINSSANTIGSVEQQQRLQQIPDEKIPKNMFRIFPKNNPHYCWTMKNAGPLYIPRKNDCLAIDNINIVLYSKLITYETQQKIWIENGKVLLNDSVITKYIFKKNYYFMAGDNVSDSDDSRYWNLLPEEMIVGIATVIWKSKNKHTGKINWKRVFKKVK